MSRPIFKEPGLSRASQIHHHHVAKTKKAQRLSLDHLPPEILYIIFEYVLFSHSHTASITPTTEQATRSQSPSAHCIWIPRPDGPHAPQTHTPLLTTNRFISACVRRVLSTSKHRGQVDVDMMWVATSGVWPTVLNPTAYHSTDEVQVLTVSVRLFDDPATMHWTATGWGRFLPIPKGEVAIEMALSALAGAFLCGRGFGVLSRPGQRYSGKTTTRVRRLVVDVQPPPAGQADRVVFCPPAAAAGYYHGWGEFGDDETSWPEGWARPGDLAGVEGPVQAKLMLLPWEGSKARARVAAADKVANFFCRELLGLMARDGGLLGAGLERVEFRVGGVVRRVVDVCE